MAAKRVEDGEESSFLGDKEGVCKLCYKNRCRYTCPRCNLGYCSSQCYKSEAHASCSEEFYKESFMQGLKEYNCRPEERQKMLEMLTQLEDNTENIDTIEEDEEEEDLSERLRGVDLDHNADKVWNCLTAKEKKEFESMLRDGRLGNMLELWQPWWIHKHEDLIREIHEKQQPNSCPKVLTNIVNINKLLPKCKPADTVVFSVINVLYGYCYVARLHNGDYMATPVQSAQELLDISEAFNNKNFHSVSEAIHSCQQCVHNQGKDLFVSSEYCTAIIDDIQQVILPASKAHAVNITYVLAALSDISALLSKATQHINKDIKDHSKDSKIGRELREQRHKQRCASKKLDFLLSWTVTYATLLQACITELQIEFCCQSSNLSSYNKDKSVVVSTLEEIKKNSKKESTMIEELPGHTSAAATVDDG